MEKHQIRTKFRYLVKVGKIDCSYEEFVEKKLYEIDYRRRRYRRSPQASQPQASQPQASQPSIRDTLIEELQMNDEEYDEMKKCWRHCKKEHHDKIIGVSSYEEFAKLWKEELLSPTIEEYADIVRMDKEDEKNESV